MKKVIMMVVAIGLVFGMPSFCADAVRITQIQVDVNPYTAVSKKYDHVCGFELYPNNINVRLSMNDGALSDTTIADTVNYWVVPGTSGSYVNPVPLRINNFVIKLLGNTDADTSTVSINVFHFTEQ